MSDDPAYDAFCVAYEALRTGDIKRLEELTHLSPFPCATDGWLGRRWLTNAIDSRNPDAVAWVLSKKPDVNYEDDEGRTALMSALEVEQYGDLPESEAARLTIRLIDLLLDAGADINRRVNLNVTALHCAAAMSSPPVVGHLLAQGADPTIRDHDYDRALPVDRARKMKRLEVQGLLEQAMERRQAERNQGR